MKQTKKTFRDIVHGVSIPNRVAIITRARTANRLAKVTMGRAQRNSYAVKVRSLKALTNKFRAEVELKNDPATPGMIVVAVSKDGFGLHAPKVLFKEIVAFS